MDYAVFMNQGQAGTYTLRDEAYALPTRQKTSTKQGERYELR